MGKQKRSDGRPKQISVMYTDELERMIVDIRSKLIEFDELKYGKKFVEREMKKKKGSRYSNEAIIRMLVRAGYDVMKKDLQEKYIEAKKISGKHDNNIIIQMLLEYEQKRANGGVYDVFRI